jgi:hypothetical protein
MAFGGDGLRGRSHGCVTIGRDNQSFVPFGLDLNIFNSDAADVAVMGGVQGIG